MWRPFSLLVLFCFFALATFAQTSSFTYQGKLTDGGGLANAPYDFIFRLFDASGTQIGSDIPTDDVQVAAGIFTVTLDFGSSPFGTGLADSLEIAVRSGASTGAFTTLTPRQPLTSSPYAVKSSGSTSADTLSSACILCVTDGHIQSVDGSKVTGTVPNAANASLATTALNVSGVVGIANGGTGSITKNFVDLSTDQSVAGNKIFSGAVSVTGGNGVFNGNGSGLTNINGGNISNASVTSTQLSSDALPNSHSLTLLGSLRWDLLKGQANFTVGASPYGIAFDGTNIWVVNLSSNNVSKLRANDGSSLGVFPAGSNPSAIAFDGSNIWIANGANLVTRLRASDGACISPCNFAVGSIPAAVAFDGVNIWVVNKGSNTVSKIRASDGAGLGFVAVGNLPEGIAFDGNNLWVTNNTSNTVTKFRGADLTVLGTFPVGSGPEGIVFDGNNIWVANNGANNVTKLRPTDGAVLGTFATGSFPRGLAFDGENIWVTNAGIFTITKLRASDGTNLGTFNSAFTPLFMAFDGTNMWVTNFDSNSVTRLPPAFPQ